MTDDDRPTNDDGTTKNSHSIDLGLGFTVSWTFFASPANSKEIDVTLAWESKQLAELTVSLNGPPAQMPIDVGLARGSIEVTATATTGDVSMSAMIEIRDHDAADDWRPVVDISNQHLAYFDPTEGAVAGSATAHPLSVDPVWVRTAPAAGQPPRGSTSTTVLDGWPTSAGRSSTGCSPTTRH